MNIRIFFINLTVATSVAMAVFLIGFSVGMVRNSFVATTPAVNSTPAVALLINNGEYVKSYTGLPVPQPSTVLQLLEDTASRQRFAVEVDKTSSLGAFVKKIGDRSNGTQNMYWQYYVNGSQPLVASDKYILQGGETVLWTFSKSEL